MQKSVYSYEFKDNWEKFNETSLPKKEDFYSHINMEDSTDGDYTLAKRVCKDFEIKTLGEYHDFYIQIDTLLIVYAFENFQNMCLKRYYFNPARFLTASELA